MRAGSSNSETVSFFHRPTASHASFSGFINETLGEISVVATKPWLAYQCGQQYSITALTDSSGTIVERYTYSAYGTPTFLTPAGFELPTSNFKLRHTYTGREWDDTLFLYHYRARMFDAQLGRFCSKDPIGYVFGENLYAYLENNSTDRQDPLGLFPYDCRCTCRSVGHGMGPGAVPAPYSGPSTTIDVPSEATARQRCRQFCQAQSEPNGHYCYGDLDPLNATCGRMGGNPACPGCTPAACIQDLKDLRDVIDGTDVPLIDWPYIKEQWTLDQCDRWVRKAASEIPRFKPKCFLSVNVVRWAYIFVGGHVAIKITFCDGTVIYIDNGWTGGSDGVFFPEDVDGFPYNWPVEGPDILPNF